MSNSTKNNNSRNGASLIVFGTKRGRKRPMAAWFSAQDAAAVRAAGFPVRMCAESVPCRRSTGGASFGRAAATVGDLIPVLACLRVLRPVAGPASAGSLPGPATPRSGGRRTGPRGAATASSGRPW